MGKQKSLKFEKVVEVPSHGRPKEKICRELLTQKHWVLKEHLHKFLIIYTFTNLGNLGGLVFNSAE